MGAETYSRGELFFRTLQISLKRVEVQAGSLVAALSFFRLFTQVLRVELSEIFERIVETYRLLFHFPFVVFFDFIDIHLPDWSIDLVILYVTLGGIVSRSLHVLTTAVSDGGNLVSRYLFRLSGGTRHHLATNRLLQWTPVRVVGKVFVFGVLIPFVTWPFNALNALRAPVVASDRNGTVSFVRGEIPKTCQVIHLRYLLLIQGWIVCSEIVVFIVSNSMGDS